MKTLPLLITSVVMGFVVMLALLAGLIPVIGAFFLLLYGYVTLKWFAILSVAYLWGVGIAYIRSTATRVWKEKPTRFGRES